jgi:alpha-tubulin suppressor-like RCC1 family protein
MRVVQASSRDTWLHSFGYLPVADLGAVACTNKRNKALAEHDQLWREHLRRSCSSVSLQFPPSTPYKSRYKKLFAPQIGPNFFLAHGKLWMWGNNECGQLGLGHEESTSIPQPVGVGVAGFENIVQVAAGENHTVALGANGRVWTWGDNRHGQLGSGDTMSRAIPQCLGVGIALFENIVHVTAGENHTIAVGAYGSVWVWGDNGLGQLGSGEAGEFQPIAQLMRGVTGFGKIAQVAAGWTHTIVCGVDGNVWGWGGSGRGELGLGGLRFKCIPQCVGEGIPGFTNIVQVAAGKIHTIALGADGRVWAWGYGGHGQLGWNTAGVQFIPQRVGEEAPGFGKMVQVAVGSHHTVALGADGDVWAWGTYLGGQVGNRKEIQSTPQRMGRGVAGFANIVQIAAARGHTVALGADGRVWAWGYNERGQLGSGKIGGFQSIPQLVLVVGAQQRIPFMRPQDQWVPDDSSDTCAQCPQEFSMWNRRHHCRQCGALVCYACSNFTNILRDPISKRLLEPQRVCRECNAARP